MLKDFEEKIDKEWEEFQKNQIPTVMIIGETGSGKSSLINHIFGDSLAEVSDYESKTKNFEIYVNNDRTIRLVDSKGYELEDNSLKFIENIKNYNSTLETKGEKINLIWYCISIAGKRIQEMDLNILNLLCNDLNFKDKVAVVLTKYDEDDFEETTTREFIEILREHNKNIEIFKMSNNENLKDKIELKELLNWSAITLDTKDLKESFVSAQLFDLDSKQEIANSLIKKYSLAAAGIGAIPLPVADAPILLAKQTFMINHIAKVYGMNNLPNLIKGAVANKIVAKIGQMTSSSLLKLIPGVGSIIGGAINATIASSITYSLGMSVSKFCYINYEKYLKGEDVDVESFFDSDKFLDLFSMFFKDFKNKK